MCEKVLRRNGNRMNKRRWQLATYILNIIFYVEILSKYLWIVLKNCNNFHFSLTDGVKIHLGEMGILTARQNGNKHLLVMFNFGLVHMFIL